MEMQSWSFVIFVLLSVLLYWLAVPQRFRPHFLLAISLGYYFTTSIPFGLFLLMYLYGMYVVGILIDTAKTQKGRKAWMIVGIIVALVILYFFKSRLTLIKLFFLLFGLGGAKTAAAIAFRLGIPVGISYFTFRAIHYLVEVYRGKEVRATPLEFFLYVTFFPTMVSGPIHRFYQIGKEKAEDAFGLQLRGETRTPRFNADDISYGLWRLFCGVVKKFVIAEFFMKLAEPMMTKSGLMPTTSGSMLWFAGNAYFAYLYIDFSAYSDMAIGLSRLFGFRVMENFNWAILAPNLRDFWRRWHISLTNFVMNYVYFPLGGGRKGEFRTDVNAAITIMLVSLWHNINTSMFLWGIWEGFGLIVFRHYAKLKAKMWPDHQPTWWGKVIGICMVWTWHCIGWPIFHHPTNVAFVYYLKMFPFLQYLFPAVGRLMNLGG